VSPSAALKNPEVVAKRGGLSTILKSVIDCRLSRINEALITTILHLLNHPQTRQYVRADVELEVREAALTPTLMLTLTCERMLMQGRARSTLESSPVWDERQEVDRWEIH